jgi:hypothetical protein
MSRHIAVPHRYWGDRQIRFTIALPAALPLSFMNWVYLILQHHHRRHHRHHSSVYS